MRIPPEWRTCLQCDYLDWWGGHQGYSEYTPAAPGEVSCEKDKFCHEFYGLEYAAFFASTLSATSCSEFSLSQQARRALKKAREGIPCAE